MEPDSRLQRATVLMVAATWVVALAGLRTGILPVGQVVESVTFGLAGLLSVFALVAPGVLSDRHRPYEYAEDRVWRERRLGRLALVGAVPAFACAWFVALVAVKPSDAGAGSEAETPAEIAISANLTSSQRRDIKTVVRELKAEADPDDKRLGTALAGVAAGVPGTLTALGGLLGQATGTGRELFAGALDPLLKGTLEAGLTLNNTVKVDHPTLSLGGLDLGGIRVNLDLHRQTTVKRRDEQHHDGGKDADDPHPPATTTPTPSQAPKGS